MSGGSWIRVNAKTTGLDARTINGLIREILDRKTESITRHPQLRQEIGLAYVNAVTPFVPMKTGKLRNSGNATTDGRVYWTATSKLGYNYAGIQYETQYENYTTPDTGPYWTDHVQPGTEGWNEFVSAITPMIKEEFKNG